MCILYCFGFAVKISIVTHVLMILCTLVSSLRSGACVYYAYTSYQIIRNIFLRGKYRVLEPRMFCCAACEREWSTSGDNEAEA